MDTMTTTREDDAVIEHWQNTGAGRPIVKRFDPSGVRDEMIRSYGKFSMTRGERRANENQHTPDLNPFGDGTFIPQGVIDRPDPTRQTAGDRVYPTELGTPISDDVAAAGAMAAAEALAAGGEPAVELITLDPDPGVAADVKTPAVPVEQDGAVPPAPEGNPNVFADAEIDEMLALHWRHFQARLDEITAIPPLVRIQARATAIEAGPKTLERIKARIKEVDPTRPEVNRIRKVAGAPEPQAGPAGAGAVDGSVPPPQDADINFYDMGKDSPRDMVAGDGDVPAPFTVN